MIVINVLSKLFDVAAENGIFSYHPKCKKVRLTHFYFSDDLLIFTKGNMDSVVRVHNVLKLFYTFSSMHVNCPKCELYSSRVSRESLVEIQNFTGFKLGTLPIRYFWVTLVTKRLTEKDCAPLVEKTTAQISSWTSKFLSYAGNVSVDSVCDFHHPKLLV